MEVEVRREHVLVLLDLRQVAPKVALFLALSQRLSLELSILRAKVAQGLLRLLVVKVLLAAMLADSFVRVGLLHGPVLVWLWLGSS